MGMALSFLPFVLFLVTESLIGVRTGLVSATVLAWNLLLRHQAVKVLEIGTTGLFAVLAVCAFLLKPAWSLAGVRACVDGGLLGIVLVSLALRRPFTLQYAREQVAPALWEKPEFVRANYVITAAWALVFAVMVTADLVLLSTPRMSVLIGVAVTAAAILGAARFTSWYTAHRRRFLILCEALLRKS